MSGAILTKSVEGPTLDVAVSYMDALNSTGR